MPSAEVIELDGWVGVGMAATALGCLAYAAGYEVQAYRLRRVDVPVLPAGQRPLRVLHVSDLHMLTTDDLAQIETPQGKSRSREAATPSTSNASSTADQP